MIVQFTRYRAHSAAAPPTATQVVLTTQPGGAVEDASFTTQPVGEIRSAGDVKVSGSTAAVTATLTSGSGALIGTTTVNAVAGVFTFAGLGVDTAGMGCVITFSASGLTSAVSSSLDVDEAPTGGTVVFSDDFSSGDFSSPTGGQWAGTVWVDCVTTPTALAGSGIGTHVARFRQGASTNWGELRWNGLRHLTDVFIQYQLWWPDGTESPGVGPKVEIDGLLNDKFFRMWGDTVTTGDGATGYDFVPGSKVGASTYGTSSSGPTDGNIGIEYQYSPGDGSQYNIGRGLTPTEEVGLITDANRGRWVEIRIHCKMSTSANNDGVIQIYTDRTLLTGYTNLRNWPSSGPTDWTHGYFFGAANNGFQSGQYTYLTNVKIATGDWPA